MKFGVPMVGGHLHPDAECDSVGVAIVGIAQKDKLITSFGAKTGDKVIVAIDLDGKPHEMFKLNWDTTYDKDAKLVQGVWDQNVGENFDVMEDIARRVPLSAIRRPAWDLAVLEKLGLGAEADEEIWQRLWSAEEKLNFASTPLFLVRALKPSP